MDKRAERGQTTRQRLVEIATRQFAASGYEGTSIDAVLAESGVSRGSLYHHFHAKDALFEAVLEAVEVRIGEETLAAVGDSGDSVAALRAGCLAWIRLAGDPVVQRIVLIDAPAVLGWQRWREIEEHHALGLLRGALQWSAEEGRLDAELVDVFAHVILATMNELALLIARAPDRQVAQRTAEAAVDTFLDRLLGGHEATSARSG